MEETAWWSLSRSLGSPGLGSFEGIVAERNLDELDGSEIVMRDNTS
jgi:hypothetical protein